MIGSCLSIDDDEYAMRVRSSSTQEMYQSGKGVHKMVRPEETRRRERMVDWGGKVELGKEMDGWTGQLRGPARLIRLHA